MPVPPVNLKPSIAASSAAWRAGLRRLMSRGHYILGEELRGFEEEFARAMGARNAVGVANGTQAIELALRDHAATGEVITSALTAPFTAVGICAAGAKPRFADIDPATLQVDPASAESRITKRTSALLPVHLYGQPCALDRFVAMAKRHHLALIQDACQAHGATFRSKPLTAYSRWIAYSFYPTKNLPCLGDGGALITNDTAARDRLGMARDGGRRGGEQVSHVAGINSRLDEIQCVFLRAFLPRLEEWNAHRARIAAIYDEELAGSPGIGLVRRTKESVNHLYVIRAERRDALREYLAKQGIGTGVHYPVPLHQHPAFGEKIRLPHAERAVQEIVSLPLWPYLKENAARRVADRVKRFYR
jgi:dTDP-3-amino-3,4,6-trideoxy-alpha-D-glucose transaminase